MPILKKTLAALGKQTLSKKNFEVIVVQDGLKQNYQLPSASWRTNYQLRFLSQPHRGPAAARNLGIKRSKGKIILFLNDDVIAQPNLLSTHLQFHKYHCQEKDCCLGLVKWPPQRQLTTFEEWLYASGTQADYENVGKKRLAEYRFFFTSNLSLKKSVLLKNGLFDEDFKYPLYEDTELGYRLCQKGLKIHFEPKAIAYHYHEMNLPGYLKRLEKAGQVARLFYEKHPELKYQLFPIKLNWKVEISLFYWQLLYPLGQAFNLKSILFPNYQRLVWRSLMKGYSSLAEYSG